MIRKKQITTEEIEINEKRKNNIRDFFNLILDMDFLKLNKDYSVWITILLTFLITFITGIINIGIYIYNKNIFDFYGINIELYKQNNIPTFASFIYGAFTLFLLLIGPIIIKYFDFKCKNIFKKMGNFIFILIMLFPTTSIVVMILKNSLIDIKIIYITTYVTQFFYVYFNRFFNHLLNKIVTVPASFNREIRIKIGISIMYISISIFIVYAVLTGVSTVKKKTNYYIINSNKVVVYTLVDKYIVLDAKIEGDTIDIYKNTSTVLDAINNTVTYKKFKKVNFLIVSTEKK